MDRIPATPNPFASPRVRSTSVVVTRRTRLAGSQVSFQVGENPTHTVDVYLSVWSGLEMYRVDQHDVIRLRSFALWGQRELVVNDAPLVIRYRMLPLWSAQASYDGDIVVPELFPGLSALFRGLTMLVSVGFGIVLSGLALLAGLWL